MLVVLSCSFVSYLKSNLQWIFTRLLFSIHDHKEYWNGLPCLPPGNLPDPRIEPVPWDS